MKGPLKLQIPRLRSYWQREGWVFPVGIGLRDPKSQKRDLGHPSISPFDIASTLRYCRERMVCHFTESGARDDEGEGNITQGDEDTFGPTTTFI
jgi:hypothetical protein